MKSFYVLCVLFCLLFATLAAKKQKNNFRTQIFLEKTITTTVCANPFYLFSVSTGKYLKAIAGSPAALSSSPKTLFCFPNGNLLTADGSLSLQQKSGSDILYFDNTSAGPTPTFITKEDNQYHFQFVITTGMCGVSLATVSWDSNSQIDLAGCAVYDSRVLWYVENTDTSIRHTIS